MFCLLAEVTTIEGIINRSIQGLSQDQEARRATNPEIADKIQDFISKLEDLKKVSEPFVMVRLMQLLLMKYLKLLDVKMCYIYTHVLV